MPNLPEDKIWTGVYQWETNDRALGGPDSVFTRPTRNLTARTGYLKEQLEKSNTALTTHEQSTNHPDASIAQKGFVKLNSAVNSDSELTAATSKAVKTVMDKVILAADSADQKVPLSRKINNKSLSTDVTLNADDVNALPAIKTGPEQSPTYEVGAQTGFTKRPTFNGSGLVTQNESLSYQRTIVITSSKTYTATVGTKAIKVLIVGAGGGGGGSGNPGAGQNHGGSGGGGGGYAMSFLTSNFSPTSVTIGAGGHSEYFVGNNTSGGTSSFGILTATGGMYGYSPQMSQVGVWTASGGGGGIGSGGDINGAGGVGGHLISVATTSIIAGYGGNSILSGSPSPRVSSNGAGVNGQNGSGGSGAAAVSQTGGGYHGGRGGDGICIIEEYA